MDLRKIDIGRMIGKMNEYSFTCCQKQPKAKCVIGETPTSQMASKHLIDILKVNL